MKKINYDELIEKFKRIFIEEHRKFVDEQKMNVQSSDFLVDVSEYTTLTVEEPHRIVSEFLEKENIKNHSITNPIGSFQHDLDFHLLMLTFDERRKMDAELFQFIWEHNKTI